LSVTLRLREDAQAHAGRRERAFRAHSRFIAERSSIIIRIFSAFLRTSIFRDCQLIAIGVEEVKANTVFQSSRVVLAVLAAIAGVIFVKTALVTQP
jgi:hypothetical protein